ncbi:hypothetical protein, partial [Clostridium perfringens]
SAMSVPFHMPVDDSPDFFFFFFYAYHATKPLLTFLTEVQLLLKLVISKLKLGQMARVQSNAISAPRECRLKN